MTSALTLSCEKSVCHDNLIDAMGFYLPVPAEAHLSAIVDFVATPGLTFRASGTGKTISIWLRGL